MTGGYTAVNIDYYSILKNPRLSPKVFRKYDKNHTFILANFCQKISERGRKVLLYNVCEKNADRIYAEIVLTCMVQTTFIPAIKLQNLDK